MNSETQKRSGALMAQASSLKAVSRSSGLVLSLTRGGDLLASQLMVALPSGWQQLSAEAIKKNGGIYKVVSAYFNQVEAIVFIGASGIIVRAIAPYLKDKFSDPAVLVIDELGNHVISLLSGHVGGANQLSRDISAIIGAVPVITTASDVNDRASLDLILQALGCPLKKYRSLCLLANQKLVSKESIAIYIDPAFLEIESVSQLLTGVCQSGVILFSSDQWSSFIEAEASILKVYIGFQMSRIKLIENLEQAFAVVPKVFALGTGSRKNVETVVYQENLNIFLEKNDISAEAIRSLASVDLKSDEVCMLETAEQYDWETHFFVSEVLQGLGQQFPASETVLKALGLRAVSGPAAMLAAGLTQKEALVGETYKSGGCTFTLGRINK